MADRLRSVACGIGFVLMGVVVLIGCLDELALTVGGGGIPGACCLDDACFIAEAEDDCESRGGEFQGSQTRCDDAMRCPTATPPPEDTGGDSDQIAVCCAEGRCSDGPIAARGGTLRLDADSCSDVDCITRLLLPLAGPDVA